MNVNQKISVIKFFDQAYRTHERYWTRPNLNSVDPSDFPPLWAKLLKRLAERPPGLALDLGSGEGSDAIRLARLGYEVDALEGSATGAEKIRSFASQAGVRVNVIHNDARLFRPPCRYDVVLCNGLLHYFEDQQKKQIIRMIQDATLPSGYNMVLLFSNHNPVPDCHKAIDFFCDSENGLVTSSYSGWDTKVELEHNKPDLSHTDLGSHAHSFIKLLAKKHA